jgi:hypothetical protein
MVIVEYISPTEKPKDILSSEIFAGNRRAEGSLLRKEIVDEALCLIHTLQAFLGQSAFLPQAPRPITAWLGASQPLTRYFTLGSGKSGRCSCLETKTELAKVRLEYAFVVDFSHLRRLAFPILEIILYDK